MGSIKSKNKKNKGIKENKGKKNSSSKGEENHNIQNFDLKMKEKFNSIYVINNNDYYTNPENISFPIELTKDSYSSYNWLDIISYLY